MIEMLPIAGFENPQFLVLVALALPALYFGFRAEKRFKRTVWITKFLTISLLALAAASPSISVEENMQEEPEIVVLEDNSRSAELQERPELDLGDVEVNRKIIASGNSSDLKKGILRNLEANKSYLLMSDLQSSTGLEEVVNRFREKNSTLNAFNASMKEDASVTVKGPGSTVPGAESSFEIKVHSSSQNPKPEVTLDGRTVTLDQTSENTWRFTETFSSEGEHLIEASINTEDYFLENNNFYKTVKVREKPEILVIGEKASLGRELERFYDVDYRNSIPGDLSDYYAVISKKKFEDADIADYLVQGNGFIYTGEAIERNTLPAQPVERQDQSDGAKIMLAIDISRSTEDTGSVKKEKQIAYSLVDKMGYHNKLGVVAYNQEAYLVSEPKPLSRNRENLKEKISQLETGGNSFHHKGLQGAENPLDDTGNIILISDGKITTFGRDQNTERKSKDIAANLDVRLLTVGVGEDKNTEFLEELADLGNGDYLDAENSGRLSFRFGAGGTEGGSERITVVDKSHFITESLETDTRISGYDPVETKLGADLLATSDTGKPYLSTWRYGLGRAASFTGGTSDLGDLLRYDPKLATRTVAWAVGDPQRKRDKWIDIEDSREGETVDVQASYDIDGLKRQSDNLYTAELEPNRTGFRSFQDENYGYSYSRELEKVGYNEDMESIVTDTGGDVYGPGEQEKIIEDIQQRNNREVETKKSLSDYFLIAALLVFLSEIGYRKTRGKK